MHKNICINKERDYTVIGIIVYNILLMNGDDIDDDDDDEDDDDDDDDTNVLSCAFV